MAIKNLELDDVREKSFLRVLIFGHSYCLSSNSTEFNAEHERTYPFPCHIGSTILTFRDIYLHIIVQKKKFYFSPLQYLNSEARRKRFSQKKQLFTIKQHSVSTCST